MSEFENDSKNYVEWLRKNPMWLADNFNMEIIDAEYQKNVIYLRSKERALSQRIYLKELCVGRDARRAKGDWMFLTVNPRPDVTLKKFITICHEAMALKIFEEGQYVFEQRGEEKGDYHGFHLHALMKRTRTQSYVTKEMQRKFIDLVGNPEHIKIKWVEDSELAKIRNYMSGAKKDRTKDKKCQNDLLFRAENGLQGVYTRTGDLLGAPPVKPKLKLKL